MAVYDTQGRPVIVDIESAYTAGVMGVGVSTLGNTAGNTGTSAGKIVLAGSNNVTLSQSSDGAGNTIWIQLTGAGAADGVNIVSASGNTSGTLTSFTAGTLVLAGGNNITLSQSSNSITISGANVGGAQTGISGIGASNSTYTSGTVILSGQANITVGTSVDGASQYVRLSAPNPGVVSMGVSDLGETAGNTRVTTGRFVLAGNNITLQQTTGVGQDTIWINGLAKSGMGVADSVTTYITGYLSFANSNRVSFGLNTTSPILTASIDAAATDHSHGNPTLNLTNLSGTTGSNSAGFTLSLSAGNYLTTARASNDAVGLNTAATNVTWTVNSSGLSLNAGGYAGTGTSATNASITLNTNGLAISVAAPGAAAEANWINLSGNTAGNTTASGSTIKWYGGNNITLHGTNGSEVSIIGASGGGGAVTALSYVNTPLVASGTVNSMGGQNSLWLVHFSLSVPLSASTILAAVMSYSGTITSAATAQAGNTVQVALYSQLTDPASTSRYDTLWTGGISQTFWNSGTSSYSYAYSRSEGQTTGSSAGSNLGTASVMGVRYLILPIGSTLQAGQYVFGIVQSSSSAGYSAAMSRRAMYMDTPMSVGAGTIGGATNYSNVWVVAGTYLTTTGGLPTSVALNQMGGAANAMPFFKIGAI